jgi:hypothetical protein
MPSRRTSSGVFPLRQVVLDTVAVCGPMRIPVMAKPLVIIALSIATQACSYSVTNYIRNEASNEVVVSIQRERADLGWERKESDSIEVKPNTICSFATDSFFDISLYIKNVESGKTTNINLLREGNFTYAVGNDGQEQVVTIQKASRETKRLLGNEFGVSCRMASGGGNESS